MCSAGLIGCDVHISDDDEAGGQGVGCGAPLSCNSCPTPVQQMDTHTEKLAGFPQEPKATATRTRLCTWWNKCTHLICFAILWDFISAPCPGHSPVTCPVAHLTWAALSTPEIPEPCRDGAVAGSGGPLAVPHPPVPAAARMSSGSRSQGSPHIPVQPVGRRSSAWLLC